jgi:hypothetical protein
MYNDDGDLRDRGERSRGVSVEQSECRDPTDGGSRSEEEVVVVVETLRQIERAVDSPGMAACLISLIVRVAARIPGSD